MQWSGGRWNPPNSYPTLYLNADVVTARLQVERMCEGTPLAVDDLADDAYVLVAATIPSRRKGADAVTDAGLARLGLPASYPLRADGAPVSQTACQSIGARIKRAGAHGVWCRSASTADGRGLEFAWFPGGAQKATAAWKAPLPFGTWRYAENWNELRALPQTDPS